MSVKLCYLWDFLQNQLKKQIIWFCNKLMIQSLVSEGTTSSPEWEGDVFVSSVCSLVCKKTRCISLKIVRHKDDGRNEKGSNVKNKTTWSVAFDSSEALATFCTSVLKYNMFFVLFFLLLKAASISPLGLQQLRISASQTCSLICGKKLKHRLSSNNNMNHL